MKKVLFGLSLLTTFLLLLSFSASEWRLGANIPPDSLRKIYSKPFSQWPKATVDKSITFQELGIIPPSTLDLTNGSTTRIVELGRLLFFDPRLSAANKISCASCHAPNLHWSDGKEVSIGHNNAPNTRNSPSLENVWSLNRLFWDGRAESLEQQAEGPLTSKIEMHQDMKLLPKKLKKIKGYERYFMNAFGDSKITSERIFKSLADFQRTIVSGKTAFDRFLEGDKNSLTDKQLVGLHLFRTKARCMNCHYGPLFTDNEFHNLGLTNYGDKNEDLGLYNITKKPEDVGKFKTPGLRNVMRTGPWFHNGLVGDMDIIMNLYNEGMPIPPIKPGRENDPLLPKNDRLLRGLMLSKAEKDAVVAFLQAITTLPLKHEQPVLPN
jgi:cytochrome c peroxidase